MHQLFPHRQTYLTPLAASKHLATTRSRLLLPPTIHYHDNITSKSFAISRIIDHTSFSISVYQFRWDIPFKTVAAGCSGLSPYDDALVFGNWWNGWKEAGPVNATLHRRFEEGTWTGSDGRKVASGYRILLTSHNICKWKRSALHKTLTLYYVTSDYRFTIPLF